MKTIKLEIKKVDYKKCSKNFLDCDSCLLATAAKRQFKAKRVSEGVYGIWINGEYYKHRGFIETEFEKKMKTKEPFTILLKYEENI